jgi:haloacetate dehalogenase
MNSVSELFPEFASQYLEIGNVRLHFRVGGSGPPLLLLHGYPQTHASWHKVAPRLGERFTVVAPDLRGCGSSSCPEDDLGHRSYSKRFMASDMVVLMDRLGFQRFQVMGHDRGARVAYRMALDWPQRVQKLVVLDIATTWDTWQPAQQTARHRGVQWAFLAQPAPIPESLIGADPTAWLEGCLKRGTQSGSLDVFSPPALESYHQNLNCSDRIHAACEDFRAGATCDLLDDQADRRLGRRIVCPALVVWGRHGSLAAIADPVALWRPWCATVSGCMVESGHFIAEENPIALLGALQPFLSGSKALATLEADE